MIEQTTSKMLFTVMKFIRDKIIGDTSCRKRVLGEEEHLDFGNSNNGADDVDHGQIPNEGGGKRQRTLSTQIPSASLQGDGAGANHQLPHQSPEPSSSAQPTLYPANDSSLTTQRRAVHDAAPPPENQTDTMLYSHPSTVLCSNMMVSHDALIAASSMLGLSSPAVPPPSTVVSPPFVHTPAQQQPPSMSGHDAAMGASTMLSSSSSPPPLPPVEQPSSMPHDTAIDASSMLGWQLPVPPPATVVTPPSLPTPAQQDPPSIAHAVMDASGLDSSSASPSSVTVVTPPSLPPMPHQLPPSMPHDDDDDDEGFERLLQRNYSRDGKGREVIVRIISEANTSHEGALRLLGLRYIRSLMQGGKTLKTFWLGNEKDMPTEEEEYRDGNSDPVFWLEDPMNVRDLFQSKVFNLKTVHKRPAAAGHCGLSVCKVSKGHPCFLERDGMKMYCFHPKGEPPCFDQRNEFREYVQETMRTGDFVAVVSNENDSCTQHTVKDIWMTNEANGLTLKVFHIQHKSGSHGADQGYSNGAGKVIGYFNTTWPNFKLGWVGKDDGTEIHILQKIDKHIKLKRDAKVKVKAKAKRCSSEGCKNRVVKRGVCVKYGAQVKRKLCSSEGCTNIVVNGGVSIRHGAKVKLCSSDGCMNQAQKGGVCARHGAKRKQCSSEGCKNQAQRGGVCFRHGSKKYQCSSEGCTNWAVRGGVCIRHGANQTT